MPTYFSTKPNCSVTVFQRAVSRDQRVELLDRHRLGDEAELAGPLLRGGRRHASRYG